MKGVPAKADRATLAAPQARAGLGHSESVPDAECSFCGLRNCDEYKGLFLATEDAAICEECVELAVQVTRNWRYQSYATLLAAQGTEAPSGGETSGSTEGDGPTPSGDAP